MCRQPLRWTVLMVLGLVGSMPGVYASIPVDSVAAKSASPSQSNGWQKHLFQHILMSRSLYAWRALAHGGPGIRLMEAAAVSCNRSDPTLLVTQKSPAEHQTEKLVWLRVDR